MNEAKIVKTYQLLKQRAELLGLDLSVGVENFMIHDGDKKVICFTPLIEGVQCFLDAFEYCTSKE